jgi:RNA polymerase sigma-70 factor, ECF subfamily
MLYRDEVAISAVEREVLLLRAQNGDREALNALFESCQKKLHRRALRILPKPQDAEDAVQEAMIAAFTHLQRFQGRADFLTWATRILINAALQQIRRARAKPTLSWEGVSGEFEGMAHQEFLRDPQPSPEEQLRGREQREMLADALRKLPVESLLAIQLCEFAENPLKEAANTLGLPLTTLKTRLHRARRALAVHIKRKAQAKRAPVKQSARRCKTSAERSAWPREVRGAGRLTIKDQIAPTC